MDNNVSFISFSISNNFESGCWVRGNTLAIFWIWWTDFQYNLLKFADKASTFWSEVTIISIKSLKICFPPIELNIFSYFSLIMTWFRSVSSVYFEWCDWSNFCPKVKESEPFSGHLSSLSKLCHGLLFSSSSSSSSMVLWVCRWVVEIIDITKA